MSLGCFFESSPKVLEQILEHGLFRDSRGAGSRVCVNVRIVHGLALDGRKDVFPLVGSMHFDSECLSGPFCKIEEPTYSIIPYVKVAVGGIC